MISNINVLLPITHLGDEHKTDEISQFDKQNCTAVSDVL